MFSLKGLLFGLRDFLHNSVGRLLSVTKDKETGKSLYLSHKNQKRFYIAMIVSVGILGAVLYMTKSTAFDFSSVKKLDAQLRNKEGLSDKKGPVNSIFFQDPAKSLTASGSYGNTLSGDDPGNPNQNGSQKPGDATQVTSSECSDLVKKVKTGEVLIGSDKSRFDICIEKNVLGMSDDERKVLKAMADKNVTPTETDIFKKFFDSNSPADAKNFAKGLAFVKESGSQSLKNAIKGALDSGDLAKASGLVKDSLGLGKNKDEIAATKGMKFNEISADGNKDQQEAHMAPDKERALKDLAESIKQKDAELAKLKEQQRQKEVEFTQALKKAASGARPSVQENNAIKEGTERNSKVSDLEASIAADKEKLKKAASQMQSSLYSIVSSVDEKIDSGYSVYEEGSGLPPVKVGGKKQQVRVTTNNSKKSGIKIKPGQGVEIKRKDVVDIGALKDNMFNSRNFKLSRMEVSEKDKDKFNAKNLVALRDTSKKIELSSDTRILARLDNSILVSSSGTPQRITFKILEDVFSPKNGKLLIPAGSLAFAKTGSFDEESGAMSIRISEVTTGGGNSIDVSMTVGSGDGSEGLKGEIYDTRGKYYAGAFVSSFSAGVLSFFSSTIVAKYNSSSDVNDILTGSALGGAAEVAKEIADTFTKDMQGAPLVFRAVRGIPVVLYGGR